MIYLFYDENNKVYLKYFKEIPDEFKDKKFFITDKIDKAEDKKGKIGVLYADEKKYWYEYEDVVLSEQDLMMKKLELMTKAQNSTEDLLQEIILKVYSE